MFAKKEKPMGKKELTLDKADIKAFLGTGSRFEGKLMFDEAVRIDGAFSGEILSKDILIVGESAEIEADIRVGVLVLSGKFKGTITAATKVELKAPAHVEGSIHSPVLTVEEGVVFNGTLAMGSNQPPPATETAEK